MPQDRSTFLSLEYIRTIEERLQISYDEYGQAVFDPECINTFSLQRLELDLRDLFTGHTLQNAIIDSREFGTEHLQVATFGFTEDFDRCLKMGFLLGDRIILWDILLARFLDPSDLSSERLEAIWLVINSILEIKKVIAAGGAVVLPHPLHWSDESLHNVQSLRAIHPDVSSTSVGLVSTLSVADEIPLHPYTLFDDERSWPEYPSNLVRGKQFSEQQYALHRSIASLFGEVKFAYLDKISVTTFYEIMSAHSGIQTRIQDLLTSIPGNTEQQNIQRIGLAKRDLIEKIERRNRDLTNVNMAKGGAVVAFATAAATLVYGYANCDSSIKLLLGTSSLVGSISTALARILTKNENPLLVQAFTKVKEAAASC
jgi:hypothetical protein